MAKEQIARRTAEETLRFLEIFRGYEALWDASHETYLKKNAREEAVRKLMEELILYCIVLCFYSASIITNTTVKNKIKIAANFDIPNEECLKKRIKNIKDSYRAELNKIKRSKKSGAVIGAIKKRPIATSDHCRSD